MRPVKKTLGSPSKIGYGREVDSAGRDEYANLSGIRSYGCDNFCDLFEPEGPRHKRRIRLYGRESETAGWPITLEQTPDFNTNFITDPVATLQVVNEYAKIA